MDQCSAILSLDTWSYPCINHSHTESQTRHHHPDNQGNCRSDTWHYKQSAIMPIILIFAGWTSWWWSYSICNICNISLWWSQVKAHKFVLKSCSHVFRIMVEGDKSSSSIVYLRGVMKTWKQFCSIYMYLGEVTFFQDRIHDFFKTAKDLDLKDMISEFGDNK